jgi:hypothetical protein
MLDLYHEYGSDLSLSATGNFETATDAVLTSQTVERFLLTNPGDDPFDLTFGLGIGQMIGEPAAVQKTQALILQGLKTLDVVDQTQPITANVYFDSEGDLNASITYTDAVTSLSIAQTLAVSE